MQLWFIEIKVDIGRMYMKEKMMLTELLASIPNRICLASDLWTSINIESFISLIVHFVDLNWKLNSKLHNFFHVPPPHTSFELSKKFFLTRLGTRETCVLYHFG